MANLNHNRPYFKIIDSIKREIAELETMHKPVKRTATKMANKTILEDGAGIKPTKIDKQIHLSACKILTHYQLHREVSLCNKLVKSLTGHRKAAMIKWFCEFGGITALNPKTKMIGSELFYLKGKETRQTEAEAKPYWEFLPGINVKSYNLREALIRLIKTAEKSFTEKMPSEFDQELLKSLKNLLNT